MDPVKVGKAIKALRLRAGYTQHDLADCLNVTDKAVSKWERGLSVPDVSIVTKLSILLNCDVDNLLEGNITYLENAWQGFLVMQESGVYAGSEVFGKPLVHLFLSYFMLAGIRNIWVACRERDRAFMESDLGDGSRYGIRLHYLPAEASLPHDPGNTMVVYDDPFIYGPNLPKYFQRAMSRSCGISVLTAEKTVGRDEMLVSYDRHKAINGRKGGGSSQYCVPVLFFPKQYYEQIAKIGSLSELYPLYAEPMGNGMIEYAVKDQETLLDTAQFLRFLKNRMGKELYDLQEIAQKRALI